MAALKNYIDAVRDLPLTQKSKDEMLGGTAAALLNL
jgi:hypothetical protein